MAKKNSVWIVLLLIVVAFFLAKNLGFFSIAGRSCNLGSWHVNSFDSSKNEVKIDGSVGSYNSAGCIGTYDVTSWDRGGLNVNQNFCNSFFGSSWNSDAGVCVLTNENWFDDKEVKSVYGTCTQTCTDSRGCGGVGLGAGQSSIFNFSGGFDGFSIGLPTPYNSWVPISCSAGFIVSFKNSSNAPNNTEKVTYYRYSSNTCSVISLIPSQKTVNDYLTLSECNSKITSCTMDAKQCPDGSYVGRVGPSCEFATCPTSTSTTQTFWDFLKELFDKFIQWLNSLFK